MVEDCRSEVIDCEAAAVQPEVLDGEAAAAKPEAADGEAAAVKPEVLVSACLLGAPCRFDGGSKPCEAVRRLRQLFDLVPICPEVAARLPIPRTPSERDMVTGGTRVVASDGEDRTEAFAMGVRKTLEVASNHRAKLCVLKAKSPACGVGQVYDGTFTGTLVPGWGVAAEALRDAGCTCITEADVERLSVQELLELAR